MKKKIFILEINIYIIIKKFISRDDPDESSAVPLGMQAEKGRARDSSRSSSVRTEGPRAGPGGPEKKQP